MVKCSLCHPSRACNSSCSKERSPLSMGAAKIVISSKYRYDFFEGSPAHALILMPNCRSMALRLSSQTPWSVRSPPLRAVHHSSSAVAHHVYREAASALSLLR